MNWPTSRRRKLLRGGGWLLGSRTPLVYLLHDEFTTAESAPLTSPRTCEPGPGLGAAVDTAPVLSIAGGALLFPDVAPATANTDPAYRAGADNAGAVANIADMTPGTAFFLDLIHRDNTYQFGMVNGVAGTLANANPFVELSSTGYRIRDNAVRPFAFAEPAPGTNLKCLIMGRSLTGGCSWVVDGKLYWAGTKAIMLTDGVALTSQSIGGFHDDKTIAVVDLPTNGYAECRRSKPRQTSHVCLTGKRMACRRITYPEHSAQRTDRDIRFR